MRAAIVIDARSATPLHRQVYEAWRQGILAGRFRGRSRVPSTRELAASLGVARSTVTQAYEQLIAEGYLQSAQGSGTFVCEQLPDALLRSPATPKARAAPSNGRWSSIPTSSTPGTTTRATATRAASTRARPNCSSARTAYARTTSRR